MDILKKILQERNQTKPTAPHHQTPSSGIFSDWLSDDCFQALMNNNHCPIHERKEAIDKIRDLKKRSDEIKNLPKPKLENPKHFEEQSNKIFMNLLQTPAWLSMQGPVRKAIYAHHLCNISLKRNITLYHGITFRRGTRGGVLALEALEGLEKRIRNHFEYKIKDSDFILCYFFEMLFVLPKKYIRYLKN